MRCTFPVRLLLLTATAVATGMPSHARAQRQPGSGLVRGMQLIYASQGTESAPWVVDSLDLGARYGDASTCSYIRFGQRDIRRTCARGDTLYSWRDSTRALAPSRPLASGMTLRVATANGGTAVFETTDTESISVSGVQLSVVKTSVTTLDASGNAVRRLRERFALSLGTATDGVFETKQPDGSWKVSQEFALVRIEKPQAQSGGFVMMLGADTVQVESFTRTGQSISGVLVTRTPATKVIRYHVMLDAAGRLTRYEQSQHNVDGTALVPDPTKATMRYEGDTIIRDAIQRDGSPITQRIAVTEAAYPVGTIPIGSSFLIFELALASARTTPSPGAQTLGRLLPLPTMAQPMRTPVLFAAPDSVEVDYFRQGRMGFKFDRSGRLLRSDWRNTTYRVLVDRVERMDAEGIAKRWGALEATGKGAGPLSPRDSVQVAMGSASLSLLYSRPSTRGRTIWGDVVPFNVVWRLGADFATQFKSSADLVIGDTMIPAGEYTLWMLPTPNAPLLIVSALVKVFGTQYSPAKDVARIPLRRETLVKPVERFTLSFTPTSLRIEWSDAAFAVPMRVK